MFAQEFDSILSSSLEYIYVFLLMINYFYLVAWEKEDLYDKFQVCVLKYSVDSTHDQDRRLGQVTRIVACTCMCVVDIISNMLLIFFFIIIIYVPQKNEGSRDHPSWRFCQFYWLPLLELPGRVTSKVL